MKFLCAKLFLVASLAVITQPAAAQYYWSMSASACTPDSVSIQNNRYTSSPDSAVAPQGQNVDPVVLICSVSPPLEGPPNVLSMSYADPVAAATSVKAELVRVNRTNGARVVLATINSNSFPTQAAMSKRSVNFSHELNFGDNFYFVRIEMDRAAANQKVRVIGVSLETNIN